MKADTVSVSMRWNQGQFRLGMGPRMAQTAELKATTLVVMVRPNHIMLALDTVANSYELGNFKTCWKVALEAHSCHSSTWEGEAGRSQVWDHTGPHIETWSRKNLKIKWGEKMKTLTSKHTKILSYTNKQNAKLRVEEVRPQHCGSSSRSILKAAHYCCTFLWPKAIILSGWGFLLLGVEREYPDQR